jgi:hypothetical protein
MFEFLSDPANQLSGIGVGATLGAWIDQVLNNRSRQTIDDYLEWLDRERHEDLRVKIEEDTASVRSELESLIRQLHYRNEKENKNLAKAIKDGNTELAQELTKLHRVVNTALLQSLNPETVDFEQLYHNALTTQFSKLQMLSVREMRDVVQDLSVAYVSLRLQTSAKDFADPENCEDVLARERHLAIQGVAGSGKTTLMSWIALQCSKKDGNFWAGAIPLFLPLRRLGHRTFNEFEFQQPPAVLINSVIDLPAPPPSHWLLSALTDARAVLLIDGVDELPQHRRPQFWDWLRRLLQGYPKTRTIITSRFFPEDANSKGLLWDPPPTFAQASVSIMNNPEIKTFIERWHDAVNCRDGEEKLLLTKSRDTLYNKLALPENARIRDLCRTPLLCTMVCVLHWKESGYLPRRRSDLYARCCEMLINERDQKRDIAVPDRAATLLTSQDKEMLLQRLALDMMRNNAADAGQQIEVHREDAVRWLTPHLRCCEDVAAGKLDPGEVLNFLVARTGMLREPALNMLVFPHRSFQEYLAACACGAQWQLGELVSRATDDMWHETIVLSAGTKAGGVAFGRKLIEELIARGRSQSDHATRKACLAIAIRCLETTQQVDEEFRKQVSKVVEEIVPPETTLEGKYIAAAGDYIIPYIQYTSLDTKETNRILACIRALVELGTSSAKKLLTSGEQYGGDTRALIIEAALEFPGLDPLELPSVRAILSKKRNVAPHCVRNRVTSLHALSQVDKWSHAKTGTKEITRLQLSELGKLRTLTGIEHASGLTTLYAVKCVQLVTIENIRSCAVLREADFTGCYRISAIEPLSQLQSLATLHLTGCTSVKDPQTLLKITERPRRGEISRPYFPALRELSISSSHLDAGQIATIQRAGVTVTVADDSPISLPPF